MEILINYSEMPTALCGGVLAIGNFDGVHLGHQAVLRNATDRAKKLNVPAGVMFFTPHPRQFFSPDTPIFMLTDRAQKLAAFERAGLDFAQEVTFDGTLASMTAEDFVSSVLVKGAQVSHVVVGYDFFFGAKRSGNPETLRALGGKHGFGVTVVEPTGDGGLIYSSTAVRDALEEGQVTRAGEILGRPWQVSGVVAKGFGRGGGLGFPTANISLPPGCHLHHGIYAVYVDLKGKRYKAAAYYGKRPSFDDDVPVLEMFLFDFEGNLYEEMIVVEFVGFVRGDMKFSDMEALKLQMDADCLAVATLLKGG